MRTTPRIRKFCCMNILSSSSLWEWTPCEYWGINCVRISSTSPSNFRRPTWLPKNYRFVASASWSRWLTPHWGQHQNQRPEALFNTRTLCRRKRSSGMDSVAYLLLYFSSATLVDFKRDICVSLISESLAVTIRLLSWGDMISRSPKRRRHDKDLDIPQGFFY